MSVIALDWVDSLVRTHPDVKMTQAEFNVLSRLAAKQHPVTGECQISEDEIATLCRLSKTHVGRCLRALRKVEALASWEQGKSKFWASKFTFGLGFAFVPLCTSDPATVHILSRHCAHPVPKNGAPIRKENQRNLETLPPLATVLEEFEIKDFHYALARELGLDIGAVFCKFRDYCLATGKRYENLDSALSLWLRNERPSRAAGSPKQSNAQRAEQVNAEAQRILDEIVQGRKLPRASGE
jgi:hypothetical protein